MACYRSAEDKGGCTLKGLVRLLLLHLVTDSRQTRQPAMHCAGGEDTVESSQSRPCQRGACSHVVETDAKPIIHKRYTPWQESRQ